MALTGGAVLPVSFVSPRKDVCMNRPRILTALLIVGLAFSAPAAGQLCPKTCTASFSGVTAGSIPSGDLVTLTPITVSSGKGKKLNGACITCESCSVSLVVSWSLSSDNCLAYNITPGDACGDGGSQPPCCGLVDCGDGDGPPEEGSFPGMLVRSCGQSLVLTLEYGPLDPNYSGSCPPSPISPIVYSQTWTLNCGSCL